MNYWILSLPREDMKHCIKIGTFGLNRKYVLGRVRKGDKIACYTFKDMKIIALGEATSEYYLDDTPVFKSDGLYPDRFDFRADLLSADLDFVSMIDQLSFIDNLAYWSVYLRSGIRSIPEKDWKVIEKAASRGVLKR